MAKITVSDKTAGKGIEVRILKEGRYSIEQTVIEVEVTKSKPGKNQVKIATISGVSNGKPISIKTIDMELVDGIVAYSDANDTDTIVLDATKSEGNRYLDWALA